MSFTHRNWDVSLHKRPGSDTHLRDGTKGLQILVHAHPEHSKVVQTDSHGYVVNDTTPEVPACQSNIALLVRVCCLHNDASEGEDRLQPCILQDAALNGKEVMRIADVNLGEDVVEWPYVLPRCPAMHHDDERALAAKKVDEQLKEGVNGKGLVDITDGVDNLSSLQ